MRPRRPGLPPTRERHPSVPGRLPWAQPPGRLLPQDGTRGGRGPVLRAAPGSTYFLGRWCGHGDPHAGPREDREDLVLEEPTAPVTTGLSRDKATLPAPRASSSTEPHTARPPWARAWAVAASRGQGLTVTETPELQTLCPACPQRLVGPGEAGGALRSAACGELPPAWSCSSDPTDHTPSLWAGGGAHHSPARSWHPLGGEEPLGPTLEFGGHAVGWPPPPSRRQPLLVAPHTPVPAPRGRMETARKQEQGRPALGDGG